MKFRAIVAAGFLLTAIVLFFDLPAGAGNTTTPAGELVAVGPVVVSSATAPPQAAPTPPPCRATTSPNEIEIYLHLAINNTPFNCERWKEQNDPSFGSWDSRGSYNLPVVAAAVGLFRHPTTNMSRLKPKPGDYKINYVDWWIWFLASQTGQDPRAYLPEPFPAPPQRRNLRYFRGAEIFSNPYDVPVVSSVVTVRFWAQTNQNNPAIPPNKAQQLLELSKRYLRATWAMYGMAAGNGPVWSYDMGLKPGSGGTPVPARTAVARPAQPVPNTQYDPAAPRRPSDGRYNYDGTFVALAGTRSGLKHWGTDYRGEIYDRAAKGATGTLNVGRADNLPYRIAMLNDLERRWANFGLGESLYALTQQDRDQLRELRLNGSMTAVSHLMPWLTSIRLATTYRLIGWPGWRVSTMATNTAWNGTNFYAVAYQQDDPADPDPSHAKATFLFPWFDNRHGSTNGDCRLEPGIVRAMHDETYVTDRSGNRRLVQPRQEVFMQGVPTSAPLFHVVLSSGQDPYLETSSPAAWPPKLAVQSSPPPLPTEPGTGYGGDKAWVLNELPYGSIPVAEEPWNWVLSDVFPDFEASYVHQSAVVAGFHQHYFYGAIDNLLVGTGESLYAWVTLDPLNPPQEVMLQWNDGTWEHRAYWGQNLIAGGVDGSNSRRYMGPLPETGKWVRLEVPARDVGLEGRLVNGMAFSLYGGQATWGEAGTAEARPQTINVALNKPVIQSSTYAGIHASFAVDGITDGYNFSHTNSEPQAWWQVDLGTSYALSHINIWNRPDCCPERLSNFYVFVSEVPFTSTDLNATLNQPGVVGHYYYGTADRPTEIYVGQLGRYVRVQLAGTNYLTLTEVEVLSINETPPPIPAVTINDVAVTEGNSGTVNATFTVSLSVPTTNTVSVNLATTNGTAAAGSDYTAANGLVTFNPGETNKTINVSVIGETLVESNETFFVNLSNPVNAIISDAQGQGTINNDDMAPPPVASSDVVWVEDSLPSGAVPVNEGDNWNWVSSNAFSGALAHRSNLVSGTHQHYFYNAVGSNALQVNAGDRLFTYIYLDPASPPQEVMLQWFDGSTWVRAYWGQNLITFGIPGLPKTYVGPLPQAGRWARLEVPASLLGLQFKTLTGLAFTLHNGLATWDYSGKSRAETVWVDDSLPAGAIPVAEAGDAWNWVSGPSPAPFSGTWAHQSNLVAGTHQHYFYNATGAGALAVNTGDKLFVYVYLDPAAPPKEVMLQWLDTTNTLVRAYWGEDRIDAGVAGPLKIYAGPLPQPGRWVRLEVPASSLGLEGKTLTGMAFTLFDGRATWDRAGK